MELYEVIKDIRVKRKFTQQEMSKKLGINQSSYGKIENGLVEITVNRLNRLAEIFNMNPLDLMVYPNKIGSIENMKEIDDLRKHNDELFNTNQFLQDVMQDQKKSYQQRLNKIKVLQGFLNTLPKEETENLNLKFAQFMLDRVESMLTSDEWYIQHDIKLNNKSKVKITLEQFLKEF